MDHSKGKWIPSKASINAPFERSLVRGDRLGIECDPVPRERSISASVLNGRVELRDARNVGPVRQGLETVQLIKRVRSRYTNVNNGERMNLFREGQSPPTSGCGVRAG